LKTSATTKVRAEFNPRFNRLGFRGDYQVVNRLMASALISTTLLRARTRANQLCIWSTRLIPMNEIAELTMIRDHSIKQKVVAVVDGSESETAATIGNLIYKVFR
jgi:hypothetical protein